MSICPDKIIYSEYVDGELPSPWKEKFEAHLSSCAECQKRLASYKELKNSLKSNDFKPLDTELSFERLKVKIKQGLKTQRVEKPAFWRHSVSMPIPLVAAALLLFVLLPPSFFFASKRSNPTTVPIAYPTQNATQASFFSSPTKTINQENKFSLSVSEFMQMYMPAESEGAEVIIIKLPSKSTEIQPLFIPTEDIQTKESFE